VGPTTVGAEIAVCTRISDAAFAPMSRRNVHCMPWLVWLASLSGRWGGAAAGLPIQPSEAMRSLNATVADRADALSETKSTVATTGASRMAPIRIHRGLLGIRTSRRVGCRGIIRPGFRMPRLGFRKH